MKTLVVSPNTTDPISFYRCARPLGLMRKKYGLEFDYGETVNWSTLMKYDNVFLHRPFIEGHAEVARIAQRWGVPLWGDYDDWLFDLAIDNPAKFRFDSSKEHMEKCIEALDLCFVTTEKLKELLETRGAKNVILAPNAYDHRMFPYAAKKKERLKIVLWRGSSTHNHDLLSVLPALEALFKKHTDWQFMFCAHNPSWMFKEQHKNVHFVGPKDNLEYMKMIWEIAPGIMYHPLTNTDFNQAKSMCSWLEATHAGAAFVGPDFKEYQRPGITNYKAEDCESFFSEMDSLITRPELIQSKWESSAKYIAQNLTLDHVNEIRWKHITAL